MTFEELITKIKMEAIQIGIDPTSSPLLDSQTLIELILPRVVDLVVSNVVKDETQLHALRTNQPVIFASGFVALPAKVKEEYAETFYFVEDDSASYEPQWWDYSHNPSNIVGSFHVGNGNIYYRPATGLPGTYNGALTLNAVTTPGLPTTSGGSVVMNPYILEQLITTTVAIVRGDIPLAQIGLDFTEVMQPA